jgi:hypothetical protein
MAPLQKRALYSLIIGIIITAALAIIFIAAGGVNSFDEDVNLRLVLYAALVGVPVVFLILVEVTLKKPTEVDERDRLIIEKSFRAQWLAAILLLAGWTIVLSEVFHDRGQIPIVYLTLILISILIFSTLAKSVGILIGYWSMNRHG